MGMGAGARSRRRAYAAPYGSLRPPIRPITAERLGTLTACENLLLRRGLQKKRENTATLRIVLDPDLPTVRFNDGFANGQTQADALPRHFLSVLYLVEFLEDFFFMIVGNARSGVAYRNQDLAAIAMSNTCHNFVAIRREFQRVLVKISDDLNDALTIAFDEHRRLITLQLEANFLLASLHIELVHDGLDHGDNVVRSHLILHGTGFHSRYIEKVTNHCRKPLRAVVAQLNQTLLLFIQRTGNLLKKQVHDLTDGREGGFQIVRNMRHEIFLHAVQLAQPLRHHVEVASQFCEFVAAASWQAMPKLPLRDCTRSLREPS